MKIQKLTIDHAEDITYMLANYLLDNKTIFGIQSYKISFEILLSHTKQRISDPKTTTSYIGITDKYENLLGFISYNENTITNEFEIIYIVDTELDEYQKDALISYCVNKFSDGGYQKITTKLSSFIDYLPQKPNNMYRVTR